MLEKCINEILFESQVLKYLYSSSCKCRLNTFNLLPTHIEIFRVGLLNNDSGNECRTTGITTILVKHQVIFCKDEDP
jgi:hypothetical protein